ncbi:MAG: hypothetical protein H7X77_06460, partial [Anaerolineae bacterium]|nr:hypothetical protein [Anaerolineae bacterium]
MSRNYSSHFRRFSRHLLPGSILTLALLLLSFSVYGAEIPASSQTVPLPQPVNPTALDDGLGRDVALDGDSALVGAADALHVFVRSGTTWSYQAKLTATDGTPLKTGDVDGDTAAGYNDTNNTSGAVVVFVRSGTTWTQQAKLTIDQNIYPSTRFVGPVVIQGNQLYTGVQDTAINGDKPDLRVFHYIRSGTTWSLLTTFVYVDDQGEHSLAVDGNLAVTFTEDDGPCCYDPTGIFGLYEYDGSEWNGVAGGVFTSGDPDVPDSQGAWSYNADVSGTTIASNGYIYEYDSQGEINELYSVVFIYTRSGSTFTRQALLKPTNNLGHHYGMLRLALEGNNLLVTVRDPDTNVASILYYLRSGTTWTLQSSPVTTYPNNSNQGSPISLSGNTLLVGAESENAAYVYVLSGTTWSQQAKLTLAPDPTELLVNGSFETTDGWSLKRVGSSGPYSAQYNCFYPAYSGFCSLEFRSLTDKAVQNVDLTTHDLQAGDKIKLTGFYNKLGNTNYVADVWLYIS